MPNWKVELVLEAQKDFNSLDGSVRKRVLKQLVKLEQNPNCGDPLGNKAGISIWRVISNCTPTRSESGLFMKKLNISLRLLLSINEKTWKSIA